MRRQQGHPPLRPGDGLRVPEGFRGVPGLPALAFLTAVALPVAVLASPLPAASARHALVLVASFALYVGVAVAGRNSVLWRLRAFLAWGAVAALFHGRFQPNHLAAVLLLFLPLTMALLLSPRLGSVHRLQLLLLTGLFGALLLSTRSRGALLALVLALVVVLWLEGRRKLLGFAALAAVGLAFLARRWLVDAFILSGAAQGTTAAVVLTGRPAIWERSLLVLGDFPVTGVGLGAFHDVATELYLLEGRVGDAHDLYLQVALDLGVAGLLAFLVFVAAVLRRAWTAVAAAPEPGLKRSRRIGILAALLAFLVHGTGEAVAPGTVEGMAFFFLCGLAAAEEPVEERYGRGWVVLLLAAVFLLLPPGREVLRLNRAALITVESLLSDSSHLDAAAALEAVPACRARWLEGVLADRRDRPLERDTAWSELVRCSARYFGLLEQAVPTHLTLARLGVESQPQSPDSHFYLARALRATGADADEAAESFRRGLALDPSDALAWVQLADLLAEDDRRAALEAYREACRRGDPGANACWRGGRLAEELGDLGTALEFYDRSHWIVARRRGEDLRERGVR